MERAPAGSPKPGQPFTPDAGQPLDVAEGPPPPPKPRKQKNEKDLFSEIGE